MKQLGRRLRDGKTYLLDVSDPVVDQGEVLVRNLYSCISQGTEGATQSLAKKSLLGKALVKKEEVKGLFKVVKDRGVFQTMDLVNSKLDEYGPVGYTTCGEVVATGGNVTNLEKGDIVACAGVGYASHSELVAVPKNLCVKIESTTDFKLASINAIGAVAIQGIRLSNVQFGGSAVVIGVGLIGQIVGNVLSDMNISVYTLDLDEAKLKDSRNFSRHVSSSKENLASKIFSDFPNGIDSVIICAATSAEGLLDYAGQILRKNGDCIVVGDVPLKLNRNPYWYEKQLSLKLSTSYGPGRYDSNYEIDGVDYPYGEVRWTSNRNMQAFQSFVLKNREKLSYLISETIPFENAAELYTDINQNSSKYAIILEYNRKASYQDNKLKKSTDTVVSGLSTKYSVIGAGNHFKSTLYPNVPSGFHPSVVMNKSGLSSQFLIDKYGFKQSTNSIGEFVEMVDDYAIISSRHCDHFAQVDALKEKTLRVLLEKPLCIHSYELESLKKSRLDGKWEIDLILAYNRRYSPLVEEITKKLQSSKRCVSIEVNAGSLSESSPLLDSKIGGGRLLGEICHFIDLAFYLVGKSDITKASIFRTKEKDCSYLVNLVHENGSLSSIRYVTSGSKLADKEKILVYGGGSTFEIGDWKYLKANGRVIKRSRKQDKGHRLMLEDFFKKTAKNVTPTIDEIFHIQEVLLSLNNKGIYGNA
jgi:threonine dehydrogenase-like Zn-dependent dehydrogenase/predicted dehydrogenase